MAAPKRGLTDKSRHQLAENVAKLREKAGLTGEEVAEKIGMSPGYVHQLERGVFDPPLYVLIRLQKIFKLKNLAPILRAVS